MKKILTISVLLFAMFSTNFSFGSDFYNKKTSELKIRVESAQEEYNKLYNQYQKLEKEKKELEICAEKNLKALEGFQQEAIDFKKSITAETPEDLIHFKNQIIPYRIEECRQRDKALQKQYLQNRDALYHKRESTGKALEVLEELQRELKSWKR